MQENTTYTSGSHPNSTKPTQEDNMNVNGYKTQKTHRNKQTFIEGKMGVPPWNRLIQLVQSVASSYNCFGNFSCCAAHLLSPPQVYWGRGSTRQHTPQNKYTYKERENERNSAFMQVFFYALIFCYFIRLYISIEIILSQSKVQVQPPYKQLTV